MTRAEFGVVMGYLEAGCGKPLPADRAEVYFDLLGDLPLDVLRLAAKRVLLEHRWATFPSAAELREAAAQTVRGQVSALSAAEAWGYAWKAVGRSDMDIDGSLERALKGVPPLVVEAMNRFGIADLCSNAEPVGVLRGQFMKFFEQMSTRVERAALMPATMRQAITEQGVVSPLAAPITRALAGIGRSVG